MINTIFIKASLAEDWERKRGERERQRKREEINLERGLRKIKVIKDVENGLFHELVEKVFYYSLQFLYSYLGSCIAMKHFTTNINEQMISIHHWMAKLSSLHSLSLKFNIKLLNPVIK